MYFNRRLVRYRPRLLHLSKQFGCKHGEAMEIYSNFFPRSMTANVNIGDHFKVINPLSGIMSIHVGN